MKRLIKVMLLLVLIFIGFEFALVFLKGGHNVTYKIKTGNSEFIVKEVFTRNKTTKSKQTKDVNNYYFEITIDGDTKPTFNFKTFADYKNFKMLIKSIEYYSDDNIKCIYPVFKERKNDIDVLCSKDNILIDYKELKGTNKNLDQFVNSLVSKGYDLPAWHEVDASQDTYGKYKIYTNNIIDGDYFMLWNYIGFYIINKNGNDNIELFTRPEYDNNLGVRVGKYYVIPNYDERYDFSEINIVNLENGNIKEKTLGQKISYDSYIQGVVDNEIYLFDKENKIQYKINPTEASINLAKELLSTSAKF
jgi:hypothetical protein